MAGTIKATNLTKYFNIPLERKSTLKSYFINPFHKPKMEKFKVLDDLSFEIKEGDFVGLMGRNGSGKSTLLKIISGIYAPSSGNVDVKGRIIPFLSLGVGFNDELSGRENVYLNGTILGLSKKYLKSVYEEIVDFAELGDFMDLPLKNYSSGMRVRLGFAIAMKAKADIFILDEVIAVGDGNFKRKSLSKMKELLSTGATVILVSHNSGQIKANCNRVMVLEDGKITYDGDVDEGIQYYESNIIEAQTMSIDSLDKERSRANLRKFELISLEMENGKGKKAYTLKTGDKYTVRIKLRMMEDVFEPWIGFVLTNLPNYQLHGARTKERLHLPPMQKGSVLEVEFSDVIRLKPGFYDLKFKVADAKFNELKISWYPKVLEIEVKEAKVKQWEIVKWEGDISYKIS